MLATLLHDGGSPPKRPKKSCTAYPMGSRASDDKDTHRSSSSSLHGSSTMLLLQHQQQQGLAAAAAAALEQQQQQQQRPTGGFAPRAGASTAGAPLRHALMQPGRSCSPPTAALRTSLTLRDTPERDTTAEAMRAVYGQPQRVAYRRQPLRKDSGLDSSTGTIDGTGSGDLASSSTEAMLRTEEDEDMESEDLEVPVAAPMSASDTMASKAMARAHSLRRRLSRAAGLVASQAMATPVPTPAPTHGLGAISPKGPTTALRDQTPSPPRHRQSPAAAAAAAAAAAHSPVTPGSPRPQRFGLPAPEEPALAKALDYITPDKLASLLQQQGGGATASVLLLDCRAALAYAHTRLPGAVHVQFSALMLRRFKRRARCPITVSDLKTSDAARLQLRHDASTLVVVYDDDTHDARPDSPVGVLVRILRDENVEPICLRGGITGFRGLFANLLEAPAGASPVKAAPAPQQAPAPAHAPVETPHAAPVEQRLPAATTIMATPQEHAPVTHPATTVFDFLMLGNSAQGTDLAFLRHHGITHIINVTQRPFAPEVVRVAKCMQIPLQDGPGHDLLSILPQALRVIDTARMEGGRALLYCSDGLSRAAAITLAYFISTRHFTLRSAFATLLRLRPAINPNEAFVEQLAQYEGIVTRAAQHTATPPRNVPPAAATRRSRLKSRV
jgi:predicted protein tyrosine phosphatase